MSPALTSSLNSGCISNCLISASTGMSQGRLNITENEPSTSALAHRPHQRASLLQSSLSVEKSAAALILAVYPQGHPWLFFFSDTLHLIQYQQALLAVIQNIPRTEYFPSSLLYHPGPSCHHLLLGSLQQPPTWFLCLCPCISPVHSQHCSQSDCVKLSDHITALLKICPWLLVRPEMVYYKAHAFALAELASLLVLKQAHFCTCCSIFLEQVIAPKMAWLALHNHSALHWNVTFQWGLPQFHRFFCLLIHTHIFTSCFSLLMRAEITAVTPEHCLEYSRSSVVFVDKMTAQSS